MRAARAIDTVPDAELRAIIPDQVSNIFTSEVLVEVMKLPEAQREVLFLVLIEGFRYSEAAKLLNVPIGTGMSRLSAARGKLAWMRDDTAYSAQRKGQA